MNFDREYVFFLHCVTCILTFHVNGQNNPTTEHWIGRKSNLNLDRTIDETSANVKQVDNFQSKSTVSKVTERRSNDTGNGTPATDKNVILDIPIEGGSIQQPLNSFAQPFVRPIESSAKNESQAIVSTTKETSESSSPTISHIKNLSEPITASPKSTAIHSNSNGSVSIHETKAAGRNKSSEAIKRKPKPKPTVTIGGAAMDEPIPPSPTLRESNLPRKVDYLVPTVITVLALPLLATAAFILYTRGREFWDKRHYRRMDFLIDGMYNE